MKSKYIKYAKNVISRGDVINKAKTQFMNFSKSSLISEQSSDFFEHDSFYEGGEDDPQFQGRKEETKAPASKEVREFRGIKQEMKRVRGKYLKNEALKRKDDIFQDLDESLSTEDVYRAMDLIIQDSSEFLRTTNNTIQLKKSRIKGYADSEFSEEDSFNTSMYDEEFQEDYSSSINTSTFEELEEYQGIKYLPPPFRHKYELSLWKADVLGISKVMSKYFTPSEKDISSDTSKTEKTEETKKKRSDNQEIMFSMDVSIDKKTIVISERELISEDISVMIFDIYSLEMISEQTVNIVNKINKKYNREYDKDEDLNTPEEGEYCPTSEGFPKITSFGNGEYLLVGVGNKPKSKKISEFRIYDTEQEHIHSTFSRVSHHSLVGIMHSIYSHPDDRGIFYLLTKIEAGFVAYKLDMLHNECEFLCRYEGEGIQRILISEDCKEVFLIQTTTGENARHHLYSAPLGKTAYFDADSEVESSPRVEVVYSFKTVSSSLIIVYEEYSQTKVGILNDGVFRAYDDKFQNAQNAHDYSLLNSGNVLMMKSPEDYSFECLILKKSSK